MATRRRQGIGAGLWLLAVAGMAASVLVVGCSGEVENSDEPATVTLVVSVPTNTPPEDSVFVHSGPDFIAPLEQGEDGRWRVTISAAELEAAGLWVRDQVVRYAYSRGQGYVGGEALPGDPAQEEWWVYRTASLTAGGETQEDVVERWRWFDLYPEPPAYTPHLEPFAPRLGGAEFQAGQMIADFWTPDLPPQVESTHRYLSTVGVTWVQIAPPWDYIEQLPLPRFDDGDSDVGYFEEELRWHVRQAKADGFKVLLMPQICCSEAPNAADLTPEWFDAYFVEYERFLLFHAEVAEDLGVDAFLIDWSGAIAMPGQRGVPEDAAERWLAMLERVHAAYSGPVGLNTLTIGPVGEYSLPWPWESGLSEIVAGLDFLGVAVWGAVATSAEAEYEEIAKHVEERFAASIDALHEVSGLPVVLSAVAYGTFDGAALSEFGVFEVALSPFFQEALEPHTYDAVEQAMVMDAVMAAVARRPHILGAYTFHYNYVSLPHATDYSVRGKLAESVLAEWYRTSR